MQKTMLHVVQEQRGKRDTQKKDTLNDYREEMGKNRVKAI